MTDENKPVLPRPAAVKTAGVKPTKLLKDEYADAPALYADIEANMDALLAESAPIHVDGRIVFPLNADGTTIDTGRVFDEDNDVYLKSKVGASVYATVNGKLKR